MGIGELFPVQSKELITFPYLAGQSLATWSVHRDDCLRTLAEEGNYNFSLWDATSLGPNELVVYQGGFEGDDPKMMTRSEIEATGVTMRAHPVATYAVMHPDESLFNFANDAAYDPTCTEAEYDRRVAAGVNHADFEAGINADGLHDRMFVRFQRPAAPHEEIYITYGWAYWADYRSCQEDFPALDAPELGPLPELEPIGLELSLHEPVGRELALHVEPTSQSRHSVRRESGPLCVGKPDIARTARGY